MQSNIERQSQLERGLKSDKRKPLTVIDMFITVIVMMLVVSQAYTYIKMY